MAAVIIREDKEYGGRIELENMVWKK